MTFQVSIASIVTVSLARQPDIPIRAVGQLACGRQKILINTNKYKYYLQIQTQIQTNKQTHRFFCPATGHSIGRLCYWKAIRKKKADAKTSSLIPPEYTKSGPLQSIFVQFWIFISYFKSSFLFVLSMCPCRSVGRMPITDCTKKCRGDLKYYTAGKSHDRINGTYSILSTKLLVRFSAKLVPFLICTVNQSFGATHN